MKVKYLGHACFFLQFDKYSFVIDPFGDIGYQQDFVKADYCLTTHEHFDHATLTRTEFKYLIDKNSKEFPNFLKVIPSYHDEVLGAKRGINNVYVIDLDGMRVCHLGDIGQNFDLQFCKKLGKIDVIFVPVGGKYTIDSKTAKEYVTAINPKIVIPMHYKTKSSSIDVATKNEFLSFYKNTLKVLQTFEISSLPQEMVVYNVDDSNF